MATAAFCALLGCAAPARAERAFGARYIGNANGGIALAANTLESCPDAIVGCAQARAGIGSLLDDNDFAMRVVDIDGDPSTFDSSRSRLSLPPGARVLFAGLYTGGRTEAGTRGTRAADATPNGLGTVLLKVPGGESYERLSPADATIDQSTGVRGAYQTLHDVTDLVRGAGAGEYTVADVQAGTGVDRYAGWALLVAYAAPGDPPRNLSIFDGLQSVTRGQPPLSIPVSGFLTPPDGAVKTEVGVVAYEGDLGSGGDGIAINGHPLSDPAAPVNNFFDSGISIDGVPSTDKTPDYRNQLGFDAKLTRADSILPNATSSANLSLTTSLEQYLPGAVAFATDLYSPDLQVSKSVQNVTHPDEVAHPGDRLRYTITYRSLGPAAADDVVATDPLPAGITLVPGSLRIGDQSQTDPPGDDRGAYDPQTRTVRFLLGDGATPDHGGTLRVGDQATVSFEAEIDPTSAAGEIVNTAASSTSAASLSEPLTAVSGPAQIAVRPADQPIPLADISTGEQQTVSDSGGVSETSDMITVVDHGPDTATDVQTQIDVPAGETVKSVSTGDGSCTIDQTVITCTVKHLPIDGAVQIDLVEDEPSADLSTVPMTETTTTADQLDEVAANNAAITPRQPEPHAAPASDDARLMTSIRSSVSAVELDQPVKETVTVRDVGPGAADSFHLEATPSLRLTAVRVRARGVRCTVSTTIRCSARRLAAGAVARVTINGRPRQTGRLRWRADASSDSFDPHPQEQTAQTSTPVHLALRPLTVELTTRPSTIARGGTAQVRLLATNRLPTAVLNTAVCLRVGPALQVLAAQGTHRVPDGRCWTLGSLAGGRPRQLIATVEAYANASPGPVRLTATVAARHLTPAHATALLTVHRPFTSCTATDTHYGSPGERPDC